MKKLFLLNVLILSIGIAVSAQEKEKGIVFRDDAFATVLKESARTGKLVFIDCYTSWCAPCKWMEKNVFVNDTAAVYYNAKFINYKIDMEKGEGPELRKRYGVQVFPTYLFINAKGELVHKATSRMEALAFVEEGKKALDPSRSFAAMEKAFNSGNRSKEVLLAYALALQKTDRYKADTVSGMLIAKLTDSDLQTPLGWQAIEAFAWEEEGRLGKYFMDHLGNYTKQFNPEAVKKVQERLQSSTLYTLIRKKDSTAFYARLNPWLQSSDVGLQKKAAMMEAEFYLTAGNAKDFVRVTNRALEGVMQNDDMGLGFLARRCQYLAAGNHDMLHQAYKLAKRAVVIAPKEYSNQATLAKICQELGNKQEALEAAEAAYKLSLLETSKIQKIAQKELDEIKAMK
ncbi:thioredoxin family protein [Chitinophaga polysaccharea]|uniref:thioredoxin family protein n=1 Tax=Chitinophaga polysaccharea TaxID=1293035 RepID=UPI0014555CDF|nr:thioredoxin family protein [Chitinophaga polysaccharea]NLR57228.1 thioredoxin family protein [Chitinophaga polysaccharea]